MEQHVQLQFTAMNNNYVVIIITIILYVRIINMCTMYKWYVVQ